MMKIIGFQLLIMGCVLFGTSSCTEAPQVNEQDEFLKQLHQIDSIYNSGQLIHLDAYEIGKFKDIEISVESIDVNNYSFQYINLDAVIYRSYGNRQREVARILPAECKYLISAIDVIKKNLNRSTNHEERYVYVTKDGIRIGAYNWGGAEWTIIFSTDYNNEYSKVYLNAGDLDSLKSIINQSLVKIEEIKKL